MFKRFCSCLLVVLFCIGLVGVVPSFASSVPSYTIRVSGSETSSPISASVSVPNSSYPTVTGFQGNASGSSTGGTFNLAPVLYYSPDSPTTFDTSGTNVILGPASGYSWSSGGTWSNQTVFTLQEYYSVFTATPSVLPWTPGNNTNDNTLYVNGLNLVPIFRTTGFSGGSSYWKNSGSGGVFRFTETYNVPSGFDTLLFSDSFGVGGTLSFTFDNGGVLSTNGVWLSPSFILVDLVRGSTSLKTYYFSYNTSNSPGSGSSLPVSLSYSISDVIRLPSGSTGNISVVYSVYYQTVPCRYSAEGYSYIFRSGTPVYSSSGRSFSFVQKSSSSGFKSKTFDDGTVRYVLSSESAIAHNSLVFVNYSDLPVSSGSDPSPEPTPEPTPNPNQDILDGLDSLGSSLNEHLDAVQDAVQAAADQAHSDHEEAEATRKGIWETLKDIPGAILDGIVHLFVPTQEDLEDIRDAYEDMFSSKLGFVAQVGQLIVDLFTNLIDFGATLVDDTNYRFHFPGIYLPFPEGLSDLFTSLGWEVPTGVYQDADGSTTLAWEIVHPSDVSIFNDYVMKVRPYLSTIVNALITFNLIRTGLRLFEAVFITRTGTYFWSNGGEDAENDYVWYDTKESNDDPYGFSYDEDHETFDSDFDNKYAPRSRGYRKRRKKGD